jgi:MFS family permease
MASPRDLRLLVGAVGISALGDALTFVVLLLWVQEASDSGLVVAALLLALWGPVVVLAPAVGLLVDRVETRRLILLASVAQAVVAVLLATTPGVGGVIALTCLLGVGIAAAQPAEFALIPVVSGAERVQQANGQVETARYVGWLLGPMLGGVLAAAGGTGLALLINAGTFVAVALAAWALAARRPPAAAADGAGPGRARDGLVFLFRDRKLAVVVVVGSLALLFLSASTPSEVFFATEVLDAGELGYAAMITAWTVGMGLGATLIARRVPAPLLAAGALVAVVVQGAGMAGATVHLTLAVAVGGFLVGGIGHGAKNVLMRTLVHERVPARLHGRAFAAFNGLRNAAELVALAIGGALVALLGARWTLLIAGAVPVLAGLAGLGALRARREPVRAEARPA